VARSRVGGFVHTSPEITNVPQYTISRQSLKSFLGFSTPGAGSRGKIACSIFPLLPEGGLMRRRVLLTYICLTLASLSGCHLCHKKHVAAVSYTGCASCGCDGAVAAPMDVVHGPAGVVVAGPPAGIPGPPGGAIPGPPGR